MGAGRRSKVVGRFQRRPNRTKLPSARTNLAGELVELARGRVEMRRSLCNGARLPVPNHDFNTAVVRVVGQLEVA